MKGMCRVSEVWSNTEWLRTSGPCRRLKHGERAKPGMRRQVGECAQDQVLRGLVREQEGGTRVFLSALEGGCGRHDLG